MLFIFHLKYYQKRIRSSSCIWIQQSCLRLRCWLLYPIVSLPWFQISICCWIWSSCFYFWLSSSKENVRETFVPKKKISFVYKFESVKRFGDIVQNYLILLVWQKMMKRKLTSWCVMKIDGDKYDIYNYPSTWIFSVIFCQYLLQIKSLFPYIEFVHNTSENQIISIILKIS